MQDDDAVMRALHFPRAFPDGVFAQEAFFRFVEVEDHETAYALSVASRFLLKNDDGAHSYGCRSAAQANLGFHRRNGRPPSAHETVYYIGFWDLRAGAVKSIRLNHYRVELRWAPENGEDAHFEISLHLHGGSAGKKERKKDRQLARTRLTMCLLAKPKRHVCEGDARIRHELEAIEISPPEFVKGPGMPT